MSKYLIPEARKQFLLDNFVEYNFGEDDEGNEIQPSKQVFDSITDPAEIFFIAERCNWDDGALIPQWIIDSPLCTKAAALVIFWTSAPDEYMEYNFGEKIRGYNHGPGEIDEHETSILNLLEKLVQRFERNDFCDYKIKFDFKFWGCKLLVNSPKWSVGQEFFKSIDGVEVV
jgi:hypothetical protein